MPAPVSAVISTRIKPGQEAAYRAWEQRIAAAQSKAPGFQGYRFEPPVPGVQDDWLAILRFDTEANLQAWLDRRSARSSCETPRPSPRNSTPAWPAPVSSNGSRSRPRGRGRAAWKQNMLVLLLLYPIVFLFGLLVQTPLLGVRAGLPFAVALFIGNVVSVVLLGYLVPWTSTRFAWWLEPPTPSNKDRHPRNGSCERALPRTGRCIPGGCSESARRSESSIS